MATTLDLEVNPKYLADLDLALEKAERLGRTLEALTGSLDVEVKVLANTSQLEQAVKSVAALATAVTVKVDVQEGELKGLRKQVASLTRTRTISFRLKAKGYERLKGLRDRLAKPITVPVKFVTESDHGRLSTFDAKGATAHVSLLERQVLGVNNRIEKAKKEMVSLEAKVKAAEAIIAKAKKVKEPADGGNSAQSRGPKTDKEALDDVERLYKALGKSGKLTQEASRRFLVLKDTIEELGGDYESFRRAVVATGQASEATGATIAHTTRIYERLVDELEDVNKAEEHLTAVTHLVKAGLDDASGSATKYASVLRGEVDVLRHLGPEYEHLVNAYQRMDRESRILYGKRLMQRWAKDQQKGLTGLRKHLRGVNNDILVMQAEAAQFVANMGPIGTTLAAGVGAGLIAIAAGGALVFKTLDRALDSVIKFDKRTKAAVQGLKREFDLLLAEGFLAMAGGAEELQDTTQRLANVMANLRDAVMENKEVLGDLAGVVIGTSALLAHLGTAATHMALAPLAMLADGIATLYTVLQAGPKAFAAFTTQMKDSMALGVSAPQAMAQGLKAGLHAMGDSGNELGERFTDSFLGKLSDGATDVHGLIDDLVKAMAGVGQKGGKDIFVYDDEALNRILSTVERQTELLKEQLAVKRAMRGEDAAALKSLIQQKEETLAALGGEQGKLNRRQKDIKAEDERQLDKALTGGSTPADPNEAKERTDALKNQGKGTKALEKRTKALNHQRQVARTGLKALREQYKRLLAIQAQYSESLRQEAVTNARVETTRKLSTIFDLGAIKDELRERQEAVDDASRALIEAQVREDQKLEALRAARALLPKSQRPKEEVQLSAAVVKDLQAKEDGLRIASTNLDQTRQTLRAIEKIGSLEERLAMLRTANVQFDTAEGARSRVTELEREVDLAGQTLALYKAQASLQQEHRGQVDPSLTEDITEQGRDLAAKREELVLTQAQASALTQLERSHGAQTAGLERELALRANLAQFSIAGRQAQVEELEATIDATNERRKLLQLQRAEAIQKGLTAKADTIEQELTSLHLKMELDEADLAALEKWPLDFEQTGQWLLGGLGTVFNTAVGQFQGALVDLASLDMDANEFEEAIENSLSDLGGGLGAALGASLNPALGPLFGLAGAAVGAVVERYWDTAEERKAREEERRKEREKAIKAAEQRHKDLLALQKEANRLNGRILDNTARFLDEKSEVQNINVKVERERSDGRLY